MRISIMAVFLWCGLWVSAASAQNQITGKWLSEDKEGITEIYKQNGKFYGKIVWLRNPEDDKGTPFTDTENPEKALKKRPLQGLVILEEFYYQNNEWKGGKIYDPESGKSYTCLMWLADKNTLKVKGYWGIFYQTQTWKRTE